MKAQTLKAKQQEAMLAQLTGGKSVQAKPVNTTAKASKPLATAKKGLNTTPAQEAKQAPIQEAGGVFNLIAYIVAGIESRKGLAYYKRAFAYHAKQKTSFPRPLVSEARLSLTKEKADQVFKQADSLTLASGSHDGQACFDIYMMSQAKA